MTNDLIPDAPKFEVSILFGQNYHTETHITVNQGGTSSGKTYAITQVLLCLACQTAKLVITIVGQDIPNLKAGALRDALSIYNNSTALKSAVKNYNKTDRIFEFHNGTIMEFKSYSDAQDAKSGKRDYLFINEANGITYAVYQELALRTRKRIYIDYNPNTGFWVHEHLIGRPDVQLIISDHRHNPFLDKSIREKIEGLKKIDIELWKVYARGLTGKITGLIFSNWYVCDQISADAKLIGIGLDFGFTNDETACLEVYLQNGELWVNELFYQTGLTNIDIAAKLKGTGVSRKTEIIADSAEPKSIEEFKRMGWYITGAKKGPDSINNSIDILKRYKINVTRASVNLRKELDRYKWRVDKSGKTINEAVDSYNHLIDALRYVALNKLKVNTERKIKSRMPYNPQSANRSTLNELIGPIG
ncbi:PBSX family phage terminase large subunit [Mucilaginibacter sp.]|uniref:PBSX family phage terminase large subunit n=1 Tax=Mucilaginibacter sp. TaxID=1882438 RepID=UPI0025FD781C|nr:PBSX family phage terminase large subunit [Mucilaginibacter sp.]